MRLIPITAIAIAGGLTFAAAAVAQTPAPATPSMPPAKGATPTLPDAATAAREKSEGAQHAADVAKDRASPNSAVAPSSATDTDASAKAPDKDADDATAVKDDGKGKKKHGDTAATPKPH